MTERRHISTDAPDVVFIEIYIGRLESNRTRVLVNIDHILAINVDKNLIFMDDTPAPTDQPAENRRGATVYYPIKPEGLSDEESETYIEDLIKEACAQGAMETISIDEISPGYWQDGILAGVVE